MTLVLNLKHPLKQTVYFSAVVSDNVGINAISLTGATQDSVSGSTYIFKEYDYADYNFGSNTDNQH